MIPCYGTHGSKQRINTKSIQEKYKICVFVAEAYVYVVQFRPYQGVKKVKQVASFTKGGLRQNVILQLMTCLTPTFSFDMFMYDYLTYFSLLTNRDHFEQRTLR